VAKLARDTRRAGRAHSVNQPPILEIEQLRRRFGDHDVLRGIDLSLGPGERLALTGPNGSGKTTLLRCASGTLMPTTGHAKVCGEEAGSMAARRRVGTSLSQERSFYLRLTGRENLMFFSRLRHDRERQARRNVEAIVEELELEQIAAERAGRCSTGMVQQLSFARALLGDPSLLLLDEPTRSLDATATARLWAALERRQRMAVLIATHRSDDLERCDRQLDLAARQ
jgi:ABC-type multidrug transport system ATPase subunit